MFGFNISIERETQLNKRNIKRMKFHVSFSFISTATSRIFELKCIFRMYVAFTKCEILKNILNSSHIKLFKKLPKNTCKMDKIKVEEEGWR